MSSSSGLATDRHHPKSSGRLREFAAAAVGHKAYGVGHKFVGSARMTQRLDGIE